MPQYLKRIIVSFWVIAAIVVDIIWIIGPKNIPLLSEIWDLLESLIAKLTVTAGGIVGFTIDTIKDGEI